MSCVTIRVLWGFLCVFKKMTNYLHKKYSEEYKDNIDVDQARQSQRHEKEVKGLETATLSLI